MSRNSSTTRPSRPYHSSARYSPYSRSVTPAPSSPSLSSTGRHAASHSAETYLSPASSYHTHPPAFSDTTHPVPRYLLANPSPTLQSNAAVQSSSSNYQLEHSRYQSRWLDPQSNRLAPLSHQHTLSHPLHPATYPDPPIVHRPQPRAWSIHGEQPLYQPELPVYQNHPNYQNYPVHQHPIQPILGPTLTQRGPTYYGEGMFSRSQNFSVKDSTFIDNSTSSDNFMEKFLEHTIIGAEYDSSARYPPPRCHPGTRLTVVQKCKDFIVQCHGEEKMRWIVGAAGVGKSAIMQMIAEETPADASVFLSVNGRQDGTKTFATIAYQLAAKYEPYCQFVRKEISRDPSLLQKSLPVQFQKFIVDPFIHRHLFNPLGRYVVILDGLDECHSPVTQQELLKLISDFCLSYPASPLVWLVASRPEPHITWYLSDARVAQAYTKEEIEIDSDEACEDVQRYLRDELARIKRAYPTLERRREWPSELKFTKIANAAGGLFAYASTVVRYIGDPYYGDPVSQLSDVLAAIDAGPKDDTLRKNNPLALLDALYERILSNIPDSTMINTKKLLLVRWNHERWSRDNFRLQCNRLGLTEDAAYGAVRHLHAVMRVPVPDRADDEPLTYFHKSFEDFLFDSERSRFSSNGPSEMRSLMAQFVLRIVQQTPDKFDCGAGDRGIDCYRYGYLKDSPGFCDSISLSWPGDERYPTTDHELRRKLYTDSIEEMCRKFRMDHEFFSTISCFHALTTRFTVLGPSFPIAAVRDCVFDSFRHELTELGQLKQVPLKTLDYAAICGWIDLRLMSLAELDVPFSDPWNPGCKHLKFVGPQQLLYWSTAFERPFDDAGDIVTRPDVPRYNIKAGKDSHWECVRYRGGFEECLLCYQRLVRHFLKNPDALATVFVDSTDMCYVEWSFVDPDDGVLEWRYRFFHSGAPSGI